MYRVEKIFSLVMTRECVYRAGRVEGGQIFGLVMTREKGYCAGKDRDEISSLSMLQRGSEKDGNFPVAI